MARCSWYLVGTWWALALVLEVSSFAIPLDRMVDCVASQGMYVYGLLNAENASRMVLGLHW